MKPILNSKKAEFDLNSLSGIVTTFFVTAITLGLLAAVLVSFQSSSANNYVAFPRNDSLIWAGNNTAIKLTNQDVASVVLYNNGSLVNQGNNYTVSASDGRITITNNSDIWNATNSTFASPNQLVTAALNVSYSYSIGSPQRNLTGLGLTTVNTLTSYLPTVALVAVAAVVVGLVLLMFRKKQD